MKKSESELAELLQSSYDITVSNWGPEEGFAADSMYVQRGEIKERLPHEGSFLVRDFKTANGERYKLVEYAHDFAGVTDLETYMKDEDLNEAARIDFVAPENVVPGYTVYKLTPYFVGGEPQWGLDY